MRRLLSILLLALFGLPFVSPLFALGNDVDANLPACCRRDGTHHCMGSMVEHGNSPEHKAQWSAPLAKCPYSPASVANMHPNLLAPAVSAAIFAGLVSHPAGTAQTESKRRISCDRSRQKRGPPASITL